MVAVDLIHDIAIRWGDLDPKYATLLLEGGVSAVVSPPNEAFEKACSEAGIRVVGESEVRFAKGGLWPGVQRPDPQTAGATHSPWIDQNCSLVNFLRALHLGTPVVLGYRPDKDAGVSPNFLLPYDSLELALAEAWVSGGNYVMALHPRFRDGLLSEAADALAAWRKIGQTAKWLRANQPLFGFPALPIVTVLVDEEGVSEEIAHLCFRQNVSPALVDAANPPAPDPARRLVLAAVGIATPKGEVRERILAHARAGTTVVVDAIEDDAWWRVAGLKLVRSDHDRDYYSLGKGQVAAYKASIDDPGMLALDLIDIVTQQRRPARIWDAHAGLVMATSGPKPGSGLLKIVNYSRPSDVPVLARIQGSYQRATVLRPRAEALELKVMPRGTASEVAIPRLERVAVVVFS